jgi:hypothetical protein
MSRSTVTIANRQPAASASGSDQDQPQVLREQWLLSLEPLGSEAAERDAEEFDLVKRTEAATALDAAGYAFDAIAELLSDEPALSTAELLVRFKAQADAAARR